jgi:uroporphyrin-3 C-methyltransferase
VLTVAVIASLLAAFFWWQSRASLTTLAEQNQALEDRNRALGDELSATRAQVAAFDEQIAGLEGELEGNSTRVTALSEDVTALPPEIRELERRIETLQGGRLDARAIWLKEQAEYYLVLANTELTLGRRVGTAVDALELADDVLRDLGDPDLARVRNAISAELQALRAVEQPDLERLTGDLSGLEDRAANLPMRAQTPENFVVVDENQDAEDEPGLGRLWSATKGAMRSIVRVERQEEPVDQLLTESERRIVRRQLELELSLARTALLDRRQADFRAALVAADGILNREFNREAQSVVAARELLASMMQVELAPALPSIGDSLSLLRSAPGGD